MICPGCDASVPDEAGFCRGCGTIVRGPRTQQTRAPTPYVPPIGGGRAPHRMPAYTPPPAGYPPAAGPFAATQPYGYGSYGSYDPYAAPVASWQPDAAWRRHARTASVEVRSTGAEFFVALFTGLTLLSLFLPWYKVRLADNFGDSISFSQTSALGSWAGGWRFALLASAIFVLGYLATRLLFGRYWPPGFPHFALLTLLALGNLGLVIVAFFELPVGGVSVTSQGVTFGVTQAWAAYVALFAAILAAAAAISNRPRISRRV